MKNGTLKGEFQLGLNSNGHFTLRIRDVTSNVEFIEAKIQPADLALAMSGRAGLPIEFEVVSEEAFALLGKVARYRSVGLDKGDVELHSKEWRYLDRKHPHRQSLYEAFRSWIEGAALAKAKATDDLGDIEWRPGWRLHVDGIGTQQPTALHTVSLVRYDDPAPTPQSPTADELS